MENNQKENEELYTILWSDIESTEMDYENYLDDIENFFREDFENDILEEEPKIINNNETTKN